MDIGMGLGHDDDLQEEKDSEDGERRKHSLYAIANTLKKLLTFFPAPNLGLDGTSRTKVKEFPGSFSYSGHPDNNGSSWTYRSYDGSSTGGLGPGTGTGSGPGPGPGKKSSFGLRRKNLKSGLNPPSARSTSSSLFSRSTVLNNLMNNNISDDDGDGNGNGNGNGRTSRISRGYNNGLNNMRPSLSLTTSFDFTSCELDLPGRPYDQTVSKSKGGRGVNGVKGLEGGNNWGLLSNVDC